MKKFRVTGNYAASMTLDIMAESQEKAEEKAREIFEMSDSDSFIITDEIDIDVDDIYDDKEDETPRPIADRLEPLIDRPDDEPVAMYEAEAIYNNSGREEGLLESIEDTECEVINSLWQ